MSFDLAFWHESKPTTAEEAARIYDKLTDGEIGIADRHPAVGAFYDDVIAAFGDLTEENAEESPWMSPLYRNEECVIANIAWSRHREVGPVLVDLASNHGLTTYDPQDKFVHHPIH